MSLAQVNREYSTGAQPILSKSLLVPVLSGTPNCPWAGFRVCRALQTGRHHPPLGTSGHPANRPHGSRQPWEPASMTTWLCGKILTLTQDVSQWLVCFTHAAEAETFPRRCQQWRAPTPSRAGDLTLTSRCGNVKLSRFVCSEGCKYFILTLTQRPWWHMTAESANSCEKQSPNVIEWDPHHRKLTTTVSFLPREMKSRTVISVFFWE